jgi:Glycosyl transferase family 11.
MSNAPKSDWVTGASHGIPLDQDAIAIHLRRGDYSTRRARRYHGVLDKEYYQRALKALNPSPNARYFVFSDAPEAQLLVQELVGDRSHVETVKEPQGSTPLDAMLFLASFSKVICANSTFSWWAAFLGTHDDKDVVVPANWFRSKPTCKECLFLPAWKPI